jgi:LysM repeat protein/proteasome lid subunit RPN8/RPN11
MKIEVKDNLAGNTFKICEFPFDHQYFGTDELQSDLKIFIRQDVLIEVDGYLSSDLNNELGGVLTGDVGINNDGKKFISIDGKIIAKHTNSSLSRLTFTHETWEYINEILEKDFPGKKILGWFHSHPGHTVFLSSFDVFIQENFFNMDYMVAYVFDQTINDSGFFLWEDKKIVKSPGFYVYDIKKKEQLNELFNRENKFEPVPDETINNSGDELKKTSKTGYSKYAVIGLLLFSLLLIGLMIYNYSMFEKKVLLKDEYNKEIAELRDGLEKLNDKMDNFIAASEISKTTADGDSTKIDMKKNLTAYTVKAGDTIDKLAFEFYKTKNGSSLIMKQNNLKSKWDIKTGQVLEIPVFSE